MKKYFLILLMLCAVLLNITACSENKTTVQNTVSTTNNVAGNLQTSEDIDSFTGSASESSTANTLSHNSDTQSEEGTNPAGQENNLETPAEINTDIISELGMTYSQLAEKYGEPHGTNNSYEFGAAGGYGRYAWKSDEGKIFDDDMELAGGCNYIIGIDPEDLLLGFTYPMTFDELSKTYDLVLVSVEGDIVTDSSYWAEFTCQIYDNISFIFETATNDAIDEGAKCSIYMNVDCTKAVPII